MTLVPGIGRKGAQRIVLDLKDRLGPPTGAVRYRVPAASRRPAGTSRSTAPSWVSATARREADEALALVAAAADGRLPHDGEDVAGAPPVRWRCCVSDRAPRPRDDEDDLVTPFAVVDEQTFEAGLRPRTLDEFIGQPKVREQLSIVLEGAGPAAGRRTTSCCPGLLASARRVSR